MVKWMNHIKCQYFTYFTCLIGLMDWWPNMVKPINHVNGTLVTLIMISIN